MGTPTIMQCVARRPGPHLRQPLSSRFDIHLAGARLPLRTRRRAVQRFELIPSLDVALVSRPLMLPAAAAISHRERSAPNAVRPGIAVISATNAPCFFLSANFVLRALWSRVAFLSRFLSLSFGLSCRAMQAITLDDRNPRLIYSAGWNLTGTPPDFNGCVVLAAYPLASLTSPAVRPMEPAALAQP